MEEALVRPDRRRAEILQRLQRRGGAFSLLRWFSAGWTATDSDTPPPHRSALPLQKDDVDGEIDLKSCVNVSEFDVEKNYGFQIQVRLNSVPGSVVFRLADYSIHETRYKSCLGFLPAC